MVFYDTVVNAVNETISLCDPNSEVECTIPHSPYDIVKDEIVIMFKYSTTKTHSGFFYIDHVFIKNALFHKNNNSLVEEMFQQLSKIMVERMARAGIKW